MNGKALERDFSTHTNHKYSAWIDRVVSDDLNGTTPKPLRIYPPQITINNSSILSRERTPSLNYPFASLKCTNPTVVYIT